MESVFRGSAYQLCEDGADEVLVGAHPSGDAIHNDADAAHHRSPWKACSAGQPTSCARTERMRCWLVPIRPVTPFIMMPTRRITAPHGKRVPRVSLLAVRGRSG